MTEEPILDFGFWIAEGGFFINPKSEI